MARLTAEAEGTLLLFDPRKRGGLVYPIVVNGVCAPALLDHGSALSFVDEDWCDKNGIVMQTLDTPVRLRQFLGSIGWTRKHLSAAQVTFAGANHMYSFLAVPQPPSAVVIGLDAVNAWNLCYNPLNGHVLTLPVQTLVSKVAAQERPIAILKTRQ